VNTWQQETAEVIVHYKGKTVPLQAWNGPEGARKLRFADFMTTAQDGELYIIIQINTKWETA
jgi:hypothetical protein